MVGNSIFAIQINNRLKDIKGCKDNFEGVSIIAIGGQFQLEPVMDGYVFRDLENLYYAVVAPNLWQQHLTMFEVNEIMGQRESKFFVELPKRLFIQNAKVDEFNERVHNAAIGNKHRIKVQENIIGANSAELRGKILQQISNNSRKTKQLAWNQLSC